MDQYETYLIKKALSFFIEYEWDLTNNPEFLGELEDASQLLEKIEVEINMNFKKKSNLDRPHVFKNIRMCENMKYFQQVAYSTYGEVLTQICFDCKTIRTTRKI